MYQVSVEVPCWLTLCCNILFLDVQRGMVLAKPGSIKPHSKFEASVYILKKEEGGRHSPFFTGYRPQFYMRTTDVTGNVAQVGTGKRRSETT